MHERARVRKRRRNVVVQRAACERRLRAPSEPSARGGFRTAVVVCRSEERARHDTRVWVVARDEADGRVTQGGFDEGLGRQHGGRACVFRAAAPLEQRKRDEVGTHERERRAARRSPQEYDVRADVRPRLGRGERRDALTVEVARVGAD